MKLEIDTDRFIVCGKCCEIDDFGRVTVAKARQLAKESDWIMRDGFPVCRKCQGSNGDEDDA